ncbi:MAG: non-homologous end-joining DNA ligase [Acidothermus cellulolyticus]|nr:non-homologous end-joining DNA ligase [Acidothermus cellulolyticus]
MADRRPGDLREYRRRRNFRRTPEPAGRADPRHITCNSAEPRFVVQRHRATRLHYDLRLEINGVLVSWAVPKGPTLDPTVRRAAIHVEDHPLEYLDFEGVIPHGEYGGGDVIVWDTGTWRPHGTDDPAQAVVDGELHADFFGRKLRGRFVFVRRGTDEKSWLVLHKDDEHAVRGWNPEDYPRSVLSGATNDDVARHPRRLWRGGRAHPVAQHNDTAASADELAALAALDDEGTWEVFGRRLKVTHLNKVIYPGRGRTHALTKRDLLRYAARIAPVVMPYLAGRPFNMHRFPDGIDAPGFWHKQLPSHAPDWLPRWQNPSAKRGEAATYLVVDEPAALIWAVNFGAIEWHAWTSRTDRPDLPTWALVDIDPGSRTTWRELVELALLHRDALDHLGVQGKPKLTGQRGIQIWIPIRRGPTFDDTRAWVEHLSKVVGSLMPDAVSWEWEKKRRAGRARLDFTQNAANKTLVAPYSPRPLPRAPVSAPVEWDELPHLRPDRFTVRTILDRLAERGDPFHALLTVNQQLPPLG